MVQNNSWSVGMSFLTHPLQHFFETTIFDALVEYDGKVSLCGRTIINLQFADEIDALAEEEQEL